MAIPTFYSYTQPANDEMTMPYNQSVSKTTAFYLTLTCALLCCVILFSFFRTAQAADVFSYLGGSEYDTARSIAVDKDGNMYITGWTFTTDLPVTGNAIQSDHHGEADIFIARVSADGHSVSMLTYFGGSGTDTAHDIAVDDAGNIYVTGTTNSADLMTVNPVQASLNGESDAFILKIDSSGVLTFASYFGGSGDETGQALTVNSDGTITFAGNSRSTDLFTTADALDVSCGNDGLCDASDTSNADTRQSDAYLARFTLDSSDMYIPAYATYVGGNSVDAAHDIAVDSNGVIYLTGETRSSDLVTRNALQSKLAGGFAGGYDAFVLALDPAQSTDKGLRYASYLGGDGEDSGNAIAVASDGIVTLVGDTSSSGFPVTANALQNKFFGGDADAFITQVDTRAAGSASLLYSSYIGGDSDESGSAIAIDAQNNLYIAGYTTSDNFPTQQGPQLFYQDHGDGFLLKLNSDYSPGLASFVGGMSFDAAFAVAVDASGMICLTGETETTGLASGNAWQTAYSNHADAYVTKIDPAATPQKNTNANPGASGGSGDGGGGNINLWLNGLFLLAWFARNRRG